MEQEVHLAQSDSSHIDKRFDEVLEELKKIHGAFAINEEGRTDFEGHRRFHEEKVRAAKAEAEFWKELKMEIAKKGIWSLLVIICGLIVVGLSAKIGLTR